MLLKYLIKGARQRALFLSASVLLMTWADCMASQSEREISGPPPTYLLEDVSINLTRHAGVIKGATEKRISISGTGISMFEQDDKKSSFIYSSESLIALLNSLNKIRFFELPTNHNVKYTVYLKDDGTIGKSALRMMDAANTTVCFSVPAYKKCVTYNSDIAPELEELAQRIFSEAASLVKSGETER